MGKIRFLNDDPIFDILERAVKECARNGRFDEQAARRVEAQFRRDWHGEKITVSRLGPVEKLARHQALTRATLTVKTMAEPVAKVADAEGVCRRTLYRWLTR